MQSTTAPATVIRGFSPSLYWTAVMDGKDPATVAIETTSTQSLQLKSTVELSPNRAVHQQILAVAVSTKDTMAKRMTHTAPTLAIPTRL